MQPALWRDLASSVLQKVLINSEKCLHFQQNTISVQLRQKSQQVQFIREENYLNLIMPILGMIISRSEAFHKKQTNFTKHIQRAWDSRRWHGSTHCKWHKSQIWMVICFQLPTLLQLSSYNYQAVNLLQQAEYYSVEQTDYG